MSLGRILYLLGTAGLVSALLGALALLFVESSFGQSPQNAVRVSFAECPPHMKFDPERNYTQIIRLFGTEEKPVLCTEYVDKKEDGASCQIAFVCEDAT